jgi:hypothetical protein
MSALLGQVGPRGIARDGRIDRQVRARAAADAPALAAHAVGAVAGERPLVVEGHRDRHALAHPGQLRAGRSTGRGDCGRWITSSRSGGRSGMAAVPGSRRRSAHDSWRRTAWVRRRSAGRRDRSACPGRCSRGLGRGTLAGAPGSTTFGGGGGGIFRTVGSRPSFFVAASHEWWPRARRPLCNDHAIRSAPPDCGTRAT